MQSVNRSLLQMCGLVKNILFTLEEVTVLLQIHIIEKKLYHILLGKLFDTITESQMVNNKKGNLTINITYPNTGIEIVLPTYKRETLPRRMNKVLNFH